MKTYRYTVRGRGDFPIDMLRYDSAWPESEPDSGKIHRSLDNHVVRPVAERSHEIELRGLDRPTEGRWNSFGWAVGEVEEVRS